MANPQLVLYPGVELQEDVALLQAALRREGTSISEQLRPALRELVRRHADLIQAERERRAKRHD